MHGPRSRTAPLDRRPDHPTERCLTAVTFGGRNDSNDTNAVCRWPPTRPPCPSLCPFAVRGHALQQRRGHHLPERPALDEVLRPREQSMSRSVSVCQSGVARKIKGLWGLQYMSVCRPERTLAATSGAVDAECPPPLETEAVCISPPGRAMARACQAMHVFRVVQLAVLCCRDSDVPNPMQIQ